MPPAPDTPARAAAALRPQTRSWRHMIAEASSATAESAEIRTQLRAHLAAAEQLAARRTSVEPQLHPLAVLDGLSSDWNERVAALAQLRATPAAYDLAPVVPWLCTQLTDLRAKVVSAAAVAVAAIAAARLLTPLQAGDLFEASARGANISKKIMADARKTAASSALHGQTDPDLFHRVACLVAEAPHAAGRVVALAGLVEAVDVVAGSEDIEKVIAIALAASAVDRIEEVREAARGLKDSFEKRFGATAWRKVEKGLSADVVMRLTGVKEVKGGKGVKEMIKARREALKKQKQENTDGGEAEELGRKRSGTELALSGYRSAVKKGAIVKAGKENVPSTTL